MRSILARKTAINAGIAGGAAARPGFTQDALERARCLCQGAFGPGALTVETSFSQFFGPARRALVPNLVGRGPELSAANSLSQLIGGVIRLVGGIRR